MNDQEQAQDLLKQSRYREARELIERLPGFEKGEPRLLRLYSRALKGAGMMLERKQFWLDRQRRRAGNALHALELADSMYELRQFSDARSLLREFVGKGQTQSEGLIRLCARGYRNVRLAVLLDLMEIAKAALAHPTCRIPEEMRSNILSRHTTFEENRIRLPPERLRVISLGTRCLPWNMLNRWGLRSEYAEDLYDVPFNEAVHEAETLAAILETDFADYAAPGQLRTVQGRKATVVMHQKYRVVFNHACSHWAEGNFEALTELLGRQIDNFRRLGRTNPDLPKVFVAQSVPDIAPERVLRALGSLFGQSGTFLVTYNPKPGLPPSYRRRADRHVHLELGYPRRGYDWSLEYNSDIGLQYERALQEQLLRAFEDLIR